MLATTSRLLEVVDEAHAFLPNNGSIDAAVDDCYHAQTEFAGQGELISTESFVEWALSEPDALCWLPTMHRIAAAESEQHDVRCSHDECVCALIIAYLTFACPAVFHFASSYCCTPCELARSCLLVYGADVVSNFQVHLGRG